MKRILLLNYEFPPLGGGASPVSFDIAEKLSRTGNFNVDVVTMGASGLLEYEEINANLHIYRVKCLRKKREISTPFEQLTYIISGILFLNKFLKTRYYDICHTHFILPTGIISLWVKKKFGIPYVITAHGSDVPGYNPDRFKLLHKFTGPLLRLIIGNSEKIVTPSQYLLGLIENANGKMGDKGEVIPNGINTQKFIPKKKKKVIFSAGRLLPRKGFQYLIKAVSTKDIGHEVHIAGDGPMMQDLVKLAKKSRTKIVFHGWLNNNSLEYKNLVESAEIFVLLSSSESFGMVLAEAMSAKCAVVTTKISGCAEVAKGAGLLVEPESEMATQKAINKLITNRSLLLSLQQKGYEKVRKEYEWNVVLNRYIKILDRKDLK